MPSSEAKATAEKIVENACKEICAKAGTLTVWPPNFHIMVEHVAAGLDTARFEEAVWWRAFGRSDKKVLAARLAALGAHGEPKDAK